MTFEKLNANCTAVLATQMTYDAIGRVLEMVIKPSYRITGNLEGKIFHLRFENCVYVGSRNRGKTVYDGAVEFITWGRLFESYKVARLMNATSRLTGLDPNPRILIGFHLRDHYTYYFQDPVSGDTLLIESNLAIVRELS